MPSCVGKGAGIFPLFFSVFEAEAAADLKFRAGLIVNIRRAAILCRCSLLNSPSLARSPGVQWIQYLTIRM